jgi:hypothetical protein
MLRRDSDGKHFVDGPKYLATGKYSKASLYSRYSFANGWLSSWATKGD